MFGILPSGDWNAKSPDNVYDVDNSSIAIKNNKLDALCKATCGIYADRGNY